MFNILLIDCNDERGKTLKQRIEKCSCQVEHELQIENIKPENIKNANLELMILHFSSKNPGGPQFALDNFLRINKPVIYYGGEGVKSDNNYKKYIDTAYFHESPVKTGKEEDFYIEDWLEVLHKCSRGAASTPSFDILKYGSHGAIIVKAHLLRYEVLAPFIALHLSLQAYRDNDNKDALMIAEIRKPDNYLSRENAVEELLSLPDADDRSIHYNKSNAYNDHFKPFLSNSVLNSLVTDLKNETLPDKGSKRLETVISNIEVFAHNMEQAVNFIEFGCEPGWRMFV